MIVLILEIFIWCIRVCDKDLIMSGMFKKIFGFCKMFVEYIVNVLFEKSIVVMVVD